MLSLGGLPVELPPLPVETIRDLLGICRALYLAWSEEGPGATKRLKELEEIGRQLRLAIKLSKSPPQSLGHKAAWNWAELATSQLNLLIDQFMPIKPALRAITKRVSSTGRKK